MHNADLRDELLRMARTDLALRAALAADGSLHQGYHPAMEALHLRHGARLWEILDAQDWPDAAQVGAEGAEAAWLIVQHAIGMPPLQRRVLALLEHAVRSGTVPAWQWAMLYDRIALLEGRAQRFGTQLEPDPEGWPQPCRLEDPAKVDARRARVGLEPLAQRLARDGRLPLPDDPEQFRAAQERWLQRSGWRAGGTDAAATLPGGA